MTQPFPAQGPPRGPAAPPSEGAGSAARGPGEAARTYQLARPVRLDLETFARATGTHPELVRRLVTLGVLEATADAAGHLWFPPAELITMARVRRLRAGFSINYAALGLVLDLLDRIDQLKAAQRGPRPAGGPPWT